MSKEEKTQKQVTVQDAPTESAPGQSSVPYPPGMSPYPGQPGVPAAPYPTMPGTHPGYFPGMPYPGGVELARAYVPIQRFGPLYDFGKALELGTLFPELYRPYPY